MSIILIKLHKFKHENMRKSIPFFLIAVLIIVVSVSLSMRSSSQKEILNNKGALVIDIPENVQIVIDKSCVMCHNSDSDNQAAQMHICFDKFKTGDYADSKVIGKLEGIIEVLDGGKMPPKKLHY
jgi:hypothetical protein